jgi:hypothetical protein
MVLVYVTDPLAVQCFPPDGSRFHVCCVDIQLPATPPGDPINELAAAIMATSHPDSYSWCTCSEYVCKELLGGIVEWDQHTLTRARFFQVALSVLVCNSALC